MDKEEYWNNFIKNLTKKDTIKLYEHNLNTPYSPLDENKLVIYLSKYPYTNRYTRDEYSKYLKDYTDPEIRVFHKNSEVNRANKVRNSLIPFIEDKAITLTNAGRATGAILSTNMLDSIADAAYSMNLPVYKGLGLAVKESTFGNPTFYTKQNINKEHKPYIMDGLLSNWRYRDNPYLELLLTANRKTDAMVHNNYLKGIKVDNDTQKRFKDSILVSGERYADRKAKEYLAQPTMNVLQHAFKLYKETPYNYNPGQANYVQMVE